MESNSEKKKKDTAKSNRLSRKKFLATSGLLAGYFLTNPLNSTLAKTKWIERLSSSKSKKPNILFIVTDQMAATMLSCTGNKYVHTPNLDRLANSGVRFEKAYAANPLCVPSRYSLFSGDMPSQIGLSDNNQLFTCSVPQQKLNSAMGNVFRRAGYRTVYGGKTHLVGKGDGKYENVELYGFENFSSEWYEGLADKASEFIKQKHDKPFLLVTSFMNPHDICYKAIIDFQKAQGKKELGGAFYVYPPSGKNLDQAMQKPEGVSDEEFFSKYCPPLPDNFEIPDKEPTAFMADKPDFSHWVRDNWTEKDWLMHRWAYARLTEMVDKEIGKVLDALKESGQEENTIVIYTSDHGEQDGAHRLEEKGFVYEESARVPLLVSWKGKIKPGQVDRTHLVSNGLDILPSICDLAGVPKSNTYRGHSIKPLLNGRQNEEWRKSLVVEQEVSRLVVWDNFRYMIGKDLTNTKSLPDVYGNGVLKVSPPANEIREMLIDIKSDPGEMHNLAFDKKYHKELTEGRHLLFNWYKGNGFILEDGYNIG